jgi:hypothetical protein
LNSQNARDENVRLAVSSTPGGSSASDVGALPGHRAFHQDYHGYQPGGLSPIELRF